jgi:hypothetical protein
VGAEGAVSELAIRFLLGGLVVTSFAAISEALKPKTFAGIFGAAPSVALASLFLSLRAHGAPYVSLEARSMMAGAVALLAYSAVSSVVVRRDDLSPWAATLLLWGLWLAIAFTLWLLVLRQ